MSLRAYSKEQRSGTFAREGRQSFYSTSSYVLAKELASVYSLVLVPLTYVVFLFLKLDTIVTWRRGFHIYFALGIWYSGFVGLMSVLLSEGTALL